MVVAACAMGADASAPPTASATIAAQARQRGRVLFARTVSFPVLDMSRTWGGQPMVTVKCAQPLCRRPRRSTGLPAGSVGRFWSPVAED
jgi:hypothetical protein